MLSAHDSLLRLLAAFTTLMHNDSTKVGTVVGRSGTVVDRSGTDPSTGSVTESSSRLSLTAAFFVGWMQEGIVSYMHDYTIIVLTRFWMSVLVDMACRTFGAARLVQHMGGADIRLMCAHAAFLLVDVAVVIGMSPMTRHCD